MFSVKSANLISFNSSGISTSLSINTGNIFFPFSIAYFISFLTNSDWTEFFDNKTINIEDDLIVSGGQVTIGQNAKIGGDLLVSGGKIDIDGEVTGDVQGSGGTINISGKVDGGVYIDSVGSLSIANGAEIAGDLVYTSSNEADISEGATVGGEIKPTIAEKAAEIKVPKKTAMTIFTTTYIGGKVISFLSLFVLGIILILAIPELFNKFNQRMQTTLGRCVGAGAIMLFGVPIGVVILFLIAVLLFITVVGAGLGVLTLSSNFILIVLYFVLIYISSVFLSFFIGANVCAYAIWRLFFL